MILTFFDEFTIAKPSRSKNSKNSFNLTEVLLKKNKISSILFFCNKEIKIVVFPNWTTLTEDTIYISEGFGFLFIVFIDFCLSPRWSIALYGSLLACVLHWMCQLFNGITGYHSVWTLLNLGGQTFSEKFSLSCSLSLFMAVASIICRCNL